MTIINSSFYSNTASDGGAISNDKAENIAIINSIFNNNTATSDAARNVIITNSTFTDNSCGDRGGAIDISDPSKDHNRKPSKAISAVIIWWCYICNKH